MIVIKGFLLDEKGDIVIKDGELVVISDTELTAQTLKTVIGTNKGEWFMNEEEGIDFNYMLGKGITDDMQRTQIQDACNQVDESLHVENFDVDRDKKSRTAKVNFSAKGDGDTEITLTETYGGI